jgi:hypothetical protein
LCKLPTVCPEGRNMKPSKSLVPVLNATNVFTEDCGLMEAPQILRVLAVFRRVFKKAADVNMASVGHCLPS